MKNSDYTDEGCLLTIAIVMGGITTGCVYNSAAVGLLTVSIGLVMLGLLSCMLKYLS